MKIKKHKTSISLRKVKKHSDLREDMVNRIAEFFEIPKELIGDNTKITTIGNKYIYLEGKHKIADYYASYIRIITKKYGFTISGKELEIKEMGNDELVIEGCISNIEYEKRGIDED